MTNPRGLLVSHADVIALADTLGDTAGKIDGIEIRSMVTEIEAALPGCSIPDACSQTAESTEYAWLKVAERFRAIQSHLNAYAWDVTATDEKFALDLEQFAFDDGPV